MMEQEAALKKVANRKLRRLLAYNTTFDCAEIEISESALFYKTNNRKSMSKCAGTARIQESGETGVTVRYQSQTFKVARYCVRKKVDEKELGGVNSALGCCSPACWSSVLEPDWETPNLGWNPVDTGAPAA